MQMATQGRRTGHQSPRHVCVALHCTRNEAALKTLPRWGLRSSARKGSAPLYYAQNRSWPSSRAPSYILWPGRISLFRSPQVIRRARPTVGDMECPRRASPGGDRLALCRAQGSFRRRDNKTGCARYRHARDRLRIAPRYSRRAGGGRPALPARRRPHAPRLVLFTRSAWRSRIAAATSAVDTARPGSECMAS